MNTIQTKKQPQSRVWVGLDWGGSEHSVSVVDDERKVLDQFTSGVALQDLAAMSKRLHCFTNIGGIAIEATVSPVVNYLAAEGFTIYPINPKLSKNWREGSSVAGIKSDVRDGQMLALELSRRYESLRPLEQGDPSIAELAGLCEKIRALVDQRSTLVQRLKATLGTYYPGLLGYFKDWASPVAWRFVNRFSTPERLARAKKDTVIKFLRANHMGIRPRLLEQIDARGELLRWPQPADHVALEIMALATVAQLNALQPIIDKCDKMIAERFKAHPQFAVLKSLPGAGKRLAPALAVMAVLVLTDEGNYEGMRCLSGVAPVEDKSGKRQRVVMRRRCNKHWRNTMHLFAFCSTNFCPWAKAFYKIHRERGDSHATALRKLADKWLRIIVRMLKTGEVYNDEKYIEALKRSNSPVYRRLCGQTCG